MDEKGFQHAAVAERRQVAVDEQSQIVSAISPIPLFNEGVGEFLIVPDGVSVLKHLDRLDRVQKRDTAEVQLLSTFLIKTDHRCVKLPATESQRSPVVVPISMKEFSVLQF